MGARAKDVIQLPVAHREYAGWASGDWGGGQHAAHCWYSGLQQTRRFDKRCGKRLAGALPGAGSEGLRVESFITDETGKKRCGFFHIPKASAADAVYRPMTKLWQRLDDSLLEMRPEERLRGHFA